MGSCLQSHHPSIPFSHRGPATQYAPSRVRPDQPTGHAIRTGRLNSFLFLAQVASPAKENRSYQMTRVGVGVTRDKLGIVQKDAGLSDQLPSWAITSGRSEEWFYEPDTNHIIRSRHSIRYAPLSRITCFSLPGGTHRLARRGPVICHDL
ncbi:hypothetical protein P170DRAFT_245155 [Aspergillus steynii IBT 23096]|uniref:Uncharacterized protein n=1 Tax=Aspergillus steynii IBT 23096 TaxID=1392250 RepID=A0A2I2FY46_9EURO|nr:uncharacterized protein P170DRAFT_245155 [Aspergillus steynii IBT 23096]PLB45506.1 hypothetical protein P170DRAFT_245155 [Aspergillus steynii IBT 23096]